jgi:hypothetical protein
MANYSLEKVEPVKGTRSTTEVYKNIISDVSRKEEGWYKVNIPTKKTATIYQQLSKLLKDRKDLKLHVIKEVVYIEKLEKTTVKK